MRVLFHLKVLVIGVIGGAVLYALSLCANIILAGILWLLASCYGRGVDIFAALDADHPMIVLGWLAVAIYALGRWIAHDITGLGMK